MQITCELKIILWRMGKTNSWLAGEVGVSETTVSSWVNNKQLPKLDAAYQTADVLSLPVDRIWVKVLPQAPESNE